MNGEGFQVPPDAEPLEFLMAVFRDNRQPMARRMRSSVGPIFMKLILNVPRLCVASKTSAQTIRETDSSDSAGAH
jgi:hypothetical protein